MARVRVPSLLLYVFLFFGFVGGQFFGGGLQQQQQISNPSQLDRSLQQLSPQQQGQILSDVQQHQHRFGLHQRGNNGIQQPQLFNRNQQILAQSGLFGQQLQQQFVNQAQGLFNQPQQAQQPNPPIFQQPILPSAQQPQPSTQQQPLLPTAQAQLSSSALSANPSPIPSNFGASNFLSQGSAQPQLTPQPQQNSIIFPSVPPSIGTPSGTVVQHHTQTSFTPNFLPQVTQRNQYQNTRPTADPIAVINEQIRQLDPEKHKQRIKELQDKKAIIEKHNQFVEKQYEKALKKAQQEHQEFLENQREERKKLYQKLVKSAGSENIYRYSQSLPRYIYPEETPLFEKAIKQYYLEHPTTTTTTTTTLKPTTTTTTIKATTLKKSYRKPSFLPTIVPSTVPTPEAKSIQSLNDLDDLKKQYRSQQINRDELLAHLRAAIGQDNVSKNLSSREVSLANGKKVQLIETVDPKLIPQGKEEEITLPNGDKVIAIRADPNLLSRSSKPASQGDEITLPNGQKVQVIKTTKGAKSLPNLSSGQEITLPDGQKAEIFKTSSSSAAPTYKAQEITLPNGQKVEVIKTSDPKLVPGGVALEPGSDLEKLVLAKTTTVKPPKAIFDELTKNYVPPGTDFELLKTGASGGLENIGNKLPNQKKVTFVLLEEQSDGTLKVQGVKGNGKEKPDVDLDSILKKIKAGEIKLPTTTTTTTARPKTTITSTTITEKPSSITTPKTISVTVTPNSFASNEEEYSRPTAKPLSSLSTPEEPASLPILNTNIGTQFLTSPLPVSSSYSTASDIYSSSSRSTTPNSIFNDNYSKTTRAVYSTLQDQSKQESTILSNNHNSILSQPKPTISTPYTSVQPVTEYVVKSHSKFKDHKEVHELTAVLKANGLYAMSRFLKQSGLDSVLNDTGPYTVFAPTDKAFRTLLVQLGGPERAEEKFKENPRLLSGLLLHHVIPGAFTLSSLQDEMTGVSLAGTQLRVNQYNMHDNEWNDVKLTTINGARVLEEHQDIPIPQGIAHAVDRVMFPLPVGDLVQTMQADRERRFTSFLRAVFASGLAEMLQGPKSLTLFAPTDKAFAGLSPADLTKTVADPALAKELVLRHLIQGALYTNGMRYYQVKDSLQSDAQLTISKHSGKIKVNNQHLSTANIPATNGVIHAIDALL